MDQTPRIDDLRQSRTYDIILLTHNRQFLTSIWIGGNQNVCLTVPHCTTVRRSICFIAQSASTRITSQGWDTPPVTMALHLQEKMTWLPNLSKHTKDMG